ncbi:putative integral membrane protein [Acanthocheilonema viteae]
MYMSGYTSVLICSTKVILHKMIGKNGKEVNSSKKLITNDSIDAINNDSEMLSNVEDIRHFMQPNLPLSNSINPSCFTDAYINDAKYDRFIRDKSAFYMCQLRDVSSNSNIIHPKCCYFKINYVSIISAMITGALLLLFMVYIIANHMSTAYNTTKFNTRMTYSIISFSVLALISISLFIGGILRQRKNWMLPLISSMIFSCIGLFGMLIIVMNVTVNNINKGLAKYFNGRTFIVANIVTFRVSLLTLLMLNIVVTTCYMRSYWFISITQKVCAYFEMNIELMNKLQRAFDYLIYINFGLRKNTSA